MSARETGTVTDRRIFRKIGYFSKQFELRVSNFRDS